MVLLTWLACAEPAPEPVEPEVTAPPVKLGLARAGAATGIAWVGVESGAFEAHGLDVAVVQLSTQKQLADALDAGLVDFALLGGVALVKKDFEGSDLVVLAGLVDRSTRRLAATLKVSEPTDLLGARVAVGGRTGADTLATQLALSRLGVPQDEVTWVYDKGGSLGSLARRKVQASVTAAPPRRIEDRDLKVLVELSEVPQPFPELVVATRIPTAEGPLVEPMLRGLVAAVELARSDRDRTLAVLGRHTAAAPEDLAWELDTRGPQTFTWPPEPTLVGFQAVIDHLALSAPIYVDHEAAPLLDTRVLDGLIAEGLFAPEAP